MRRVRDYMHGITLVDGDLPVSEIAKIMTHASTTKSGEIGSVLIARRRALPQGHVMCSTSECKLYDVIGILTERDIIKKVVAVGQDPKYIKGYEIMSADLITVPANAPIEEAAKIMTEKGIRRLAVTEGDNIVGIITARDIARSLSLSIRQKRY